MTAACSGAYVVRVHVWGLPACRRCTVQAVAPAREGHEAWAWCHCHLQASAESAERQTPTVQLSQHVVLLPSSSVCPLPPPPAVKQPTSRVNRACTFIHSPMANERTLRGAEVIWSQMQLVQNATDSSTQPGHVKAASVSVLQCS